MQDYKITKTCLRIDETIWKQFKIMCINKGVSANEQLTKMVHEKVNQYNNDILGETK